MIADQVQERFTAGEIVGQAQGMAVTARIELLDEMQSARMSTGSLGIGVSVPRSDDQADFLGAGANDLFKNDL